MLRNWQKEFSVFSVADLPSFGGAWAQIDTHIYDVTGKIVFVLLNNANELTSLVRVHAPMTAGTAQVQEWASWKGD